MALGVYLSASLRALARIRPGNDLACAHGARPDLIVYPQILHEGRTRRAPYHRHRDGQRGHRVPAHCPGWRPPSIPSLRSTASRSRRWAGGLRSRHAVVHGLDRLTAFLRQAHVPTPEIERAWRALATRRVHSIPRVGLTPTQIEALGL